MPCCVLAGDEKYVNVVKEEYTNCSKDLKLHTNRVHITIKKNVKQGDPILPRSSRLYRDSKMNGKVKSVLKANDSIIQVSQMTKFSQQLVSVK